MIPAPILFGALIDRACLSWQQTPEWGEDCAGGGAPPHKGACFMYDNFAMGSYLLALVFSCKTLALAFFFLALFSYKPPPPKPAEVSEPVARCAGEEIRSAGKFGRGSVSEGKQVPAVPVVGGDGELGDACVLVEKQTLAHDPT